MKWKKKRLALKKIDKTDKFLLAVVLIHLLLALYIFVLLQFLTFPLATVWLQIAMPQTHEHTIMYIILQGKNTHTHYYSMEWMKSTNWIRTTRKGFHSIRLNYIKKIWKLLDTHLQNVHMSIVTYLLNDIEIECYHH